MTSFSQTFGTILTALIVKSDTKQKELAHKLNTDTRTIRFWKTDERPFPPALIPKLIKHFVPWLTAAQASDWARLGGYVMNIDELQEYFPDTHIPYELPQLSAFFEERIGIQTDLLHQMKQYPGKSLVIWGIGGVGKTTLVTWLAQQIASNFPDGVIWASMGAHANVVDVQSQLAQSIKAMLTGTTSEARRAELKTLFRNKRCLCIIDDAWAHPQLADVMVGDTGSQFILSTRDAKVADIIEAHRIKITTMAIAESVALLRQWVSGTMLPVDSIRQLAKQVGGLPLAISLMGGQLRDGVSVRALLSEFKKRHIDLSMLDSDEPQSSRESLVLCFDLSYKRLDVNQQQRFSQLSVFAESFTVEQAVAILDLPLSGTRKILRHLTRLSLIESRADKYIFHPLVQDYARSKLLPTDEAYLRHATWFIRHKLFHPGILDDERDDAPSLTDVWPDIVSAVDWSIDYAPKLAVWAIIVAHGERRALHHEFGDALQKPLLVQLAETNEPMMQALMAEQLAYLQLWGGDVTAAINTMSRAITAWQSTNAYLAAAIASLRLAGLYLIDEDISSAMNAVRQAQILTQMAYPIPRDSLDDLRWVFYWFEMVMRPLIRARVCTEPEATDLAELARESGYPIIEARGLRIVNLWQLQHRVDHQLQLQISTRAVQLFWLWRSVGEREQAERDVVWTNYELTGRYSRRVAARFAKRLSSATTTIPKEHGRAAADEAIDWWLHATEAQRVAWFSYMMPRYNGATNAIGKPLAEESRAYRWIESILAFGTMSDGVRKTSGLLMIENNIINSPEGALFSGQKPLPAIGVKKKIQRFSLSFH